MTTRDGDASPLSLDQAAARLGWTDTRRARSGGRTNRAAMLLRTIEAQERESGREILLRLRGRRQTTLRVTMRALREHLPGLFEGERSRMAVEGRFRRVLRSIDERIDRRFDELDDRVTRCEQGVDVAKHMALEVGERLERHVRLDDIQRRTETSH